TLWAVIGAVIGLIVTPIIYGSKGRKPWMGAFVGVVMGAVGNLVLLVPLWIMAPRVSGGDVETAAASSLAVPGR
ncbi:MAG: hypothetical protein JXQ72_09775, partial [Anaerolineae bacterium]|nr:hypothetical protein [Anaerolineae bacterium]